MSLTALSPLSPPAGRCSAFFPFSLFFFRKVAEAKATAEETLATLAAEREALAEERKAAQTRDEEAQQKISHLEVELETAEKGKSEHVAALKAQLAEAQEEAEAGRAAAAAAAEQLAKVHEEELAASRAEVSRGKERLEEETARSEEAKEKLKQVTYRVGVSSVTVRGGERRGRTERKDGSSGSGVDTDGVLYSFSFSFVACSDEQMWKGDLASRTHNAYS